MSFKDEAKIAMLGLLCGIGICAVTMIVGAIVYKILWRFM